MALERTNRRRILCNKIGQPTPERQPKHLVWGVYKSSSKFIIARPSSGISRTNCARPVLTSRSPHGRQNCLSSPGSVRPFRLVRLRRPIATSTRRSRGWAVPKRRRPINDARARAAEIGHAAVRCVVAASAARRRHARLERVVIGGVKAIRQSARTSHRALVCCRTAST